MYKQRLTLHDGRVVIIYFVSIDQYDEATKGLSELMGGCSPLLCGDAITDLVGHDVNQRRYYLNTPHGRQGLRIEMLEAHLHQELQEARSRVKAQP